MALWGNTDADEAKPKWLTIDEKDTTFATDRGWVRLNGKGQEEVLCAIGGLSTSVGGADITRVAFVSTAFDKSDGGNIDVRVTFNEKVTVTGNPTLVITNDQGGSGGGGSAATLSAAYTSGSGTNRLVFRKTLAGGAGDTADGDNLTVGLQTIALAGGTMKDTGTTTNSGRVIGASVTLGAPITVAA